MAQFFPEKIFFFGSSVVDVKYLLFFLFGTRWSSRLSRQTCQESHGHSSIGCVGGVYRRHGYRTTVGNGGTRATPRTKVIPSNGGAWASQSFQLTNGLNAARIGPTQALDAYHRSRTTTSPAELVNQAEIYWSWEAARAGSHRTFSTLGGPQFWTLRYHQKR